ncbi:MAG: acetate--CoA ligase family protein [Cohaesibacter sp.]|nr:acetate--CoA ligase family protein [Cohaesibacter sp.]
MGQVCAQHQARLDRVLRPQTIAFVGGREAREAVRQCKRMGYEGKIWPVHPRQSEIEGHRCFASLDDLPSPPDATFIGVNRHATIEIVHELARSGAGGAVCYASGFREADHETGEGADLQRQLIEAAGEMPILGPNCYGLINYLDGALLWPDQHGGKAADKGVAILTQSSNMAINMTMQRRGLPLAYMMAVGNQAQTGLSDLALSVLDDPRVTALGLHIEGIDDLAKFEAMAAKAREKNIPVVVLKMGRSDVARALALSHTASLAGADDLADQFFARLGVARLASLPSFLEALKLLHIHGPLAGTSICSMSCSGGEASLMADHAEGRAVVFRPLERAEHDRIKATLSELVSVANPLDYHTFIWGNEEACTNTFAAMMGCGFDLSLLVLDFPRLDRCRDEDWQAALDGLVAAARLTGGKAAVLATLPENLPEERAEELPRRAIVPFAGIDEAYDAIEAAAFIHQSWEKALPPRLLLPRAGAMSQEEEEQETGLSNAPLSDVSHPPLMLDEDKAKGALEQHGLVVPSRRLVGSRYEALAAAQALGYPVVLKVVSSDLAHKSDVGGVVINISDDTALARAFDGMAHLGENFMIETMVRGGVAELIVGVNRDAQFGLHLVIGAGGVLVDLLKDSAIVLLPASRNDIRAAILSLKSAHLLTGYRSRPLADIEAACDAILAVADYAKAHGEDLMELDVNPLIVKQQGEGAVAADALIRLKNPSHKNPEKEPS